MKSQNIYLRLTSILIVFIMLLGFIPALPASAIDIEEESPPDFLWELDFAKMSDYSDTMGNLQYTLEGKNVTLSDVYGKKALSIIDKNGKIRYDKADLLAYVHGEYFRLGAKIGRFGFSTEKGTDPARRTIKSEPPKKSRKPGGKRSVKR